MTPGPEILIVDDDPALREIMGEACAATGHPATTAPDRATALDLAARMGTIRMALVDVVLGGGTSGFDLADEIRKARPDIEVLLLSGYGSKISMPDGFDAPILGKPLPLENLRRLLDSRLGTAG